MVNADVDCLPLWDFYSNGSGQPELRSGFFAHVAGRTRLTLLSEALPHIQCQTPFLLLFLSSKTKREDFAHNVGDEDDGDGLYNARSVEMLSVQRGGNEDVA